MSFQKSVPYSWAPGVEGDIASANYVSSVIPDGDAALMAGPEGLVIGRFAWVDENYATNKQPSGKAKPSGFVMRNLNTTFIQCNDQASMTYLPGMPVALMKGGDFFARSSNGGKRGEKVYASITDGTIICAPAGETSHSGYIETDWYCAIDAEANELVIISSTPEH
ncbi:MAG: hypothetical protein [Caudoviricetes sp.]|nr:MAG: hypothetical protein [Caudoviricetes sp.]